MEANISAHKNSVIRLSPGKQLVAICLLTSLLFPVIIFWPSHPLRIILAVPVIMFFPGYTVLLALYPRRTSLGGVERLLLSMALSLAVLPVILLLLNYVWSLELFPSLISVTAFIFIMSAVSWWRQRSLSLNDKLTITLPGRFDLGWLGIIKNRRFLLWLILIALTVLLLCSSLQLTLDPLAVEALHIFANLPLFAAIFPLWLGVFFYLAFSTSPSGLELIEQVSLALVLALVFNGFWIINSPYGFGSDHMANLEVVKSIQNVGELPSLQIIQTYPGAYLLGDFFSTVTNLGLFGMATFLRLETALLGATLIMMVLSSLLGNKRAAILALLFLVVVGAALSPAGVPSRSLAFRGDIFSGVFWVALMVIVFRNRSRVLAGTADVISTLLLIFAITITYIGHSIAFTCFFFALFIVQRWGKEAEPLKTGVLLLTFIIPVSWFIFTATRSFNYAVGLLPGLINIITSGEYLYSFGQSAGGSTGAGGIPLWLTSLSYLRWAFFGLGTLLTIIYLFRARNIGSQRRREVSVVIGIALLTVVLTLLSQRGIQFSRYMWYAPLFLAPMLVRPLFKLAGTWKRICLGVVIFVLFIISLPSFLVYYGSTFNTYVITGQDIESGEYMSSHYGDIKDLKVYTNRHYPDIVLYYLSDAVSKGPREPFRLSDEDDLWSEMNNLVSDFNDSSTPSLFVYSAHASLLWYHELGVLPDAEQWQDIERELAGVDGINLVFSNDYVQIYANPVAVALSEED